MQDFTPTPPDETPPTDTPPTDTPPTESELTEAEMLDGIMQQLGGLPSEREGEFEDEELREVDKIILDNQFKQEAENRMRRIQESVKAVAPDATDKQAHEFGIATMKGDVSTAFKAAAQILRQAEEMDEKKQEQENLHVEGGAGGNSKGGNESRGLAAAFNNMRNTYSKQPT